MSVAITRVTTRDGVRLEGAFYPATGAAPASIPLNTLLCVHGTGGNFYSSMLFDSLAEHFLPLGLAVLRVNTRGHDLMSTAATSQGGRRAGAAYEVVDDCRHDIDVWLEWLCRSGGDRIGLVGHSMGAVKSLYSQAYEPHAAVRCVVAISPPCLSYTRFLSSAHGAEFRRLFELASEHISAGSPETLMDVSFPLPMVITAQGYVEKYGEDERYNLLKFAHRVRFPTLCTFGGREVDNNAAFRNLPSEIDGLRQEGAARLSAVTIPDADHFYTGLLPELASRIAAWFEKLA